MIRNIIGKVTQDIYDGTDSRHARTIPRELHGKAKRLLDQINASPRIDLLGIPPGNPLKKLDGRLAGNWSIRINDQWRIVFKWQGNNAIDVEIVDYHA
jgi:proteic killer suppression protein